MGSVMHEVMGMTGMWITRLGVTWRMAWSLGLAPSAYWLYFDSIGWPHPYITHFGPLWATLGGNLLCLGNLVFLVPFPCITLFLAVKHMRVKRDFFSYFYFALPFIQFLGGIVNLIFLVNLLD